MFLNNNWILLEFLKTFSKVYIQQVFVNVPQNFIFSGHHVRQVLKNYLQSCIAIVTLVLQMFLVCHIISQESKSRVA